MNLHQWRAWPANAIVNDGDWHSVDPSRAWVPSPEIQLLPLPAEHTVLGEEQDEGRVLPGSIRPLQPNRLSESPVPRDAPSRQAEDDDPFVRRRSRFSLGRLVGSFGLKSRKEREEAQRLASHYVQQRKVLPAEWKAYGYWARPRIGNVVVRNANTQIHLLPAPPPEPYNLTSKQIEHVMRSVQGPDGSARPDRWISRLSHPALPPRPSLWSTPPSPVPSTPLLARHLQLNPFLEHRLTGVPPITFDIRFMLNSIILGEIPATTPPSSSTSSRSSLLISSPSDRSRIHRTRRAHYIMFDPEGPNGAQPATYPGVSALTISALADEMTLDFPWPVTALAGDNSLPVTVRDVLNAVYVNFQEFMSQEELDCLTELRRGQVERAYRERVRDLPGVLPDDGIRRVDFLGDRCVFRGLEPMREGGGDEEGFVLFVGPPQ